VGIGQRIRAMRKLNNLTQKQLAEKVNVSAQVISNWEREYTDPGHDNVAMLAKVLNCSADYLLGNTDDPTPPNQKNSLPPLTAKDERDIARDLERMMASLESNVPLAFYGEPLDEQTKELLRISLENSMRLAKQLAKQKFTPKKYRNKGKNGDS